jgi:hypothetical protein
MRSARSELEYGRKSGAWATIVTTALLAMHTHANNRLGWGACVGIQTWSNGLMLAIWGRRLVEIQASKLQVTAHDIA